MSRGVLSVTLALAACTPAGAPGDGRGAAAAQAGADSLVLERTLCFGVCPAYRLSVTRAGRVHFQSRNPGEEFHAAQDSVSPGDFAFLVRAARESGLYDMPGSIHRRNRSVCPVEATDHPTITLEIFGDGLGRRLEHYTGCWPTPGDTALQGRFDRLHRLYAAIDSVTGSARWVRPARRR